MPDVRADVEPMIVAGDRVVTHLHFTGTFNGMQGKGQTVHFIATDIYRVRDGRITDNWHLEDNLTFSVIGRARKIIEMARLCGRFLYCCAYFLNGIRSLFKLHLKEKFA